MIKRFVFGREFSPDGRDRGYPVKRVGNRSILGDELTGIDLQEKKAARVGTGDNEIRTGADAAAADHADIRLKDRERKATRRERRPIVRRIARGPRLTIDHHPNGEAPRLQRRHEARRGHDGARRFHDAPRHRAADDRAIGESRGDGVRVTITNLEPTRPGERHRGDGRAHGDRRNASFPAGRGGDGHRARADTGDDTRRAHRGHGGTRGPP